MDRDEWAETVAIIVAAIVIVVLMVALVKRGIVYGATAPMGKTECFAPSIDGEPIKKPEGQPWPERHGDCMRVLVASVVSACEKYEGEERATCYSYFLRPGRVECKPVSCAGGIVQPRESL